MTNVIPAKAGIQSEMRRAHLDARFRGHDMRGYAASFLSPRNKSAKAG